MKPLRLALSLLFSAALLLSAPALAVEATSNYHAALNSIDTGEIRGIITYLADDAFEGREPGRRGNRLVGEYIANYFRELGLEPAGDEDSCFQNFPPNYRNILAILRGSDPELSKEIILIGAHYDHVGYGNYRNSRGPVGQIHNGADDNASGVSAVMELAEAMQMLKPRPKRTLVFVAWDAEEMGMLGSQHWASNPTLPVENVVLYLNADMIGRLRNERLNVLGVRSGTGLRRLLARANAETNLRLDFTWGVPPIADHYPLFQAGVPVLTFHSGKHDQYHTPYDDADLVNMDGVRRVSRLLATLVVEAANAPSLPDYRAQAAGEQRNAKARIESDLREKPPRLGVQWRAAGEDAGVVVEAVNPQSPAQQCGLRRGDRIVDIGGRPVRGEDDFPGAVAMAAKTVKIQVVRDDPESPVELTAELLGEPVRLGISWNEDDAEPGTLILTDVISGTPGAKAGLKRLDRVLTLDGTRFKSSDEFIARLSKVDSTVEIEIERDGRIENKTIVFGKGSIRDAI